MVSESEGTSAQEKLVLPNLIVHSPIAFPNAFLAVMASNLLLTALSETYAASFFPILSSKLSMFLGGGYFISAGIDKLKGFRRDIDFKQHFGIEPRSAEVMPKDARIKEAGTLIEKLNDEFVAQEYTSRELGQMVDEIVTTYIASLTGQRIETSHRVRERGVLLYLSGMVGITDRGGGDVWVTNRRRVRMPHFIAHEFCHRKGYANELEVQILAYFALKGSDEPAFRQAALAERLYRTLSSLPESEKTLVLEKKPVRNELQNDICPTYKMNPLQLAFAIPFAFLYLAKMKATKQAGGFKDYGEGLTNFLYAVGDKVD